MLCVYHLPPLTHWCSRRPTDSRGGVSIDRRLFLSSIGGVDGSITEFITSDHAEGLQAGIATEIICGQLRSILPSGTDHPVASEMLVSPLNVVASIHRWTHEHILPC